MTYLSAVVRRVDRRDSPVSSRHQSASVADVLSAGLGVVYITELEELYESTHALFQVRSSVSRFSLVSWRGA